MVDEIDKEKKGYVSEKDFLNYYCDKSKMSAHVVWKNLKHTGYRPDLKLPHELTTAAVDPLSLPRGDFGRSKEGFEMLFGLLRTKGVEVDAWGLLQRLPPS